ncbi:MAG: hypothetical protein IT215_08405 [Chitinophagaceae bacterium]|nr:hypothetical protein [Chitinophagaceae bacterium]
MKTSIIKTIASGLILILSVCKVQAQASAKKDSIVSTTECLVITGIAVNEKKQPINGVEVKLYQKNVEMEWVEVTAIQYHDHNFKFVLVANEYYSIEISKPGYTKRLIVVSTELPYNVNHYPVFNYAFEVTLFKEKIVRDDFYLDFPIALISYDEKSRVFAYHKNYTKHIKQKIKESE